MKNTGYIDNIRSYIGNRHNKRYNMHILMKLRPYRLRTNPIAIME